MSYRIGIRLANCILFFADCNKRDKYPALADALADKMGVVKMITGMPGGTLWRLTSLRIGSSQTARQLTDVRSPW